MIKYKKQAIIYMIKVQNTLTQKRTLTQKKSIPSGQKKSTVYTDINLGAFSPQRIDTKKCFWFPPLVKKMVGVKKQSLFSPQKIVSHTAGWETRAWQKNTIFLIVFFWPTSQITKSVFGKLASLTLFIIGHMYVSCG